MDIITDLSSEAVSYITVIQGLCRSQKADSILSEHKQGNLWDAFSFLLIATEKLTSAQGKIIIKDFEIRINEIIISGAGFTNNERKKELFLNKADQLLIWLKAHLEKQLFQPDEKPGLWVTPDYWRVTIKRILYTDIDSRLKLVLALQYMPIQIVYAVDKDKSKDLELSRFRQNYLYDEQGKPLADESLFPRLSKNKTDFWNQRFVNAKDFFITEHSNSPEESLVAKRLQDLSGDYKTVAKELLRDNEILILILKWRQIALPFTTLFTEELNEIERLRAKRKGEFLPLDEADDPIPIPSPDNVKINDPEVRAVNMQLAGLAFSGGGIRSATFNLGLLQKLAELGVLPRFDYLSTVSGGGYIGAWYTSWIWRNKSIKKVVDRINTEKSTDPLAEEVRPIRWLRMFSNYLSPNVSIMSSDSWTVGVTWLRNTLINQFILLLILLSILAFIDTVYSYWRFLEVKIDFTTFNVSVASSIIILFGTYLAASGMKTYDRKSPAYKVFTVGKSRRLSLFLVTWAVLSAVMVSFWLSSESNDYDYLERVKILRYKSGIPCLVGMVVMAYIGGYHRNNDTTNETNWSGIKLNIAIFASSLLATTVAILLVSLCWKIIQELKGANDIYVFVIGAPIVLESICITVVVRMILMGKLFPDERREWWGRMGALVHRFVFWWIIITLSALCLPSYLETLTGKFSTEILPLAGGWAGLIGVAVRMAYTSTETTDKPTSGKQQAKDMFVRIAPYLFMIGFLWIGAFLLQTIRDNAINFTYDWETFSPKRPDWQVMGVVTLVLLALTVVLSWRAGVNEFSLHDFYKNRLVRAYLGATRRRNDREKTANAFTGFDRDDDIRLSSITAAKDYSGPFPLINTALNATTVSQLDRQDRMAESFVFTPLYCGFDFNATRSSGSMKDDVFNFGYRPTPYYSSNYGPLLGTAMAISGAAVSPNMGYHSSSATSFLLTMFNVRLGRWMGNPRKDHWGNSDPRYGLGYLLRDLIGKSNIEDNYVYLSDGGHFDNMGLYELVRRRCTYILLGDGEQDENALCEGLANAIRRCRIDFGVEIKIDVRDVTSPSEKPNLAKTHFKRGTIIYPNSDQPGTIIYIKTSMTKEILEDADIREYYLRNPKFPQESTGDQFFDEAQFESYRKLGYESVKDAKDIRK